MKYKYTIAQLQRMEKSRWMTDRERKVFNLYYRRGWSIEDIAAELYCSASVVKNTLKSIRFKMSENDL